MRIYEFKIIDEIWVSADILMHIDKLSADARTAHIWVTVTLDVLYPLSYAALFGGLARAGFPAKAWLAYPILICVPFDLLEGLSQVMLLEGHVKWIVLKSFVTPVKLTLFAVGVLIGLAGLIKMWRGKRT